MGITAKQRATTALTATTTLTEAEVLTAIKRAAGIVKGGGASLLTTGVANIGAQVNVMRETERSLALSLTSGKKLVELCTFSAVVASAGNVRTVRVGGLETYKTQQRKWMYLVPIGPKQIYGMAPYKKFLDAVATELNATDPQVTVTIAQPE
jgi:hypothetical protein